jgi:hypothetical protein
MGQLLLFQFSLSMAKQRQSLSAFRSGNKVKHVSLDLGTVQVTFCSLRGYGYGEGLTFDFVAVRQDHAKQSLKDLGIKLMSMTSTFQTTSVVGNVESSRALLIAPRSLGFFLNLVSFWHLYGKTKSLEL